MFKAASKTVMAKTAGSVDGIDSCIDSIDSCIDGIDSNGDSLGNSGGSVGSSSDGIHSSSDGGDGNSDGGNVGKRTATTTVRFGLLKKKRGFGHPFKMRKANSIQLSN